MIKKLFTRNYCLKKDATRCEIIDYLTEDKEGCFFYGISTTAREIKKLKTSNKSKLFNYYKAFVFRHTRYLDIKKKLLEIKE